MTKHTRIVNRMKHYGISFAEAKESIKKYDSYFPNKRNFKIDYPIEDIKKTYSLLQQSVKNAYQFKSKKRVRNYLKRINWWDQNYFFILFSRYLSKRDTEVYERLLYYYDNSFNNNKERAHINQELFNLIYSNMKNLSSEKINILKYWAKWSALVLYYYGNAVDESQKAGIMSLLKFYHELDNNQLEEASKTYVNNFYSWWD